ncbi:hypothetical protein SIO17_18515 [Pseudoalteromonas piscicida]|uniref:Uncharacterized protein n=1 Tax=Pseudoalteromonas piscicida TaxID=43662 RepID=A0ABM6NJR2_PSEO7|nr:hypothetical protein [Pseudoalteromonas piscicida]ATD09077.1 hypothetical protein PPIS_a4448 [Pseudoalteromonas piscicida]WPU31045.1 hypothetical protein SIO17_18515 [Pseudoalteromonas piscicida]
MVTTLDDEIPRVAAIFYAEKHTIAATLCREKAHRSSDFMSRKSTP